MLSVFAFHHCPAHTHGRNKRGGRSLPPAAGGATEQPRSGVGNPGGGLGGEVDRGKQGVGECEASERYRGSRTVIWNAFVMQRKNCKEKENIFHLVLLVI